MTVSVKIGTKKWKTVCHYIQSTTKFFILSYINSMTGDSIRNNNKYILNLLCDTSQNKFNVSKITKYPAVEERFQIIVHSHKAL